MARVDRTQREFERREEEILDAALELCSTVDFESVTVEQIAHLAEVGKGTVYKHFASKDELLFRLNMRFYRGLLAELRQQVGEREILEQLRHIIGYGLRYHLRHPEYRFVVDYCHRIDFMERAEETWRDDFLALERAFQEWGDPMIQAGMAAGVLEARPIDDVMVGMHVCFDGAVTMLWTASHWRCKAGERSDDELVVAITDFIMAGLTGRP